MLGAGHAGVGDHHGVAAQVRRGAACRKPARLLLPTSSSPSMTKVRSQGSWRAGLEIGLDRFEVGEVLALVVAGAAAEERAACRCAARTAATSRARTARAAARRNGRRPRNGAVRAASFGARRPGEDDRVAGGGAEPGLQADLPAMLAPATAAQARMSGWCCGWAETLGKRT